MRAVLNAIYRVSGLAAGFFLIAIVFLSVGQVIGRLLGYGALPLGEFAGYSMAASSFLGLAWTLRCGEHIRVTLAIDRLRGQLRRSAEVLCLTLAALVIGYFAWAALDMAVTSYRLDDLSQGLVPVKLWIPQSGMALGLWILLLAIVDDLVLTVRARVPSYAAPQARREASAHEV